MKERIWIGIGKGSVSGKGSHKRIHIGSGYVSSIQEKGSVPITVNTVINILTYPQYKIRNNCN